jgi:hypothetical protein
MPTRQGFSPAKKACTWPRRNRFLSTMLPSAAMPWTWKTCLAKSRPIVVTCMADGSPLVAFDSHHLGTLMP